MVFFWGYNDDTDSDSMNDMKVYSLLCLSLRLIGSLFVGMFFAYMIGYLFRCIASWIVIACPIYNSLFDGHGYLDHWEKCMGYGVNLPMLYKTETWHYRYLENPIYSFLVSIVLIWGVFNAICLLARVFSGLLKKMARTNEFLYLVTGIGALAPFTSDVDFYMVFRIWRFPFYWPYFALVIFTLLISVNLYYVVFRLALKSEGYAQVDSFIKFSLKLYFWFIMLCYAILCCIGLWCY